jgi:YHS domain-containing protein
MNEEDPMSQYSTTLDDGRVTFDTKPRLSETMAKDVVCGMLVDPRQAIQAEHAGHNYYFCSEKCRSTFQSTPEKFGG